LIHSIVSKYTDSIEDLEYEDVFQEALTHLSLKLNKYDPRKAKLSTFVYHVTRNKLSNLKNSKKNYKEKPIDYDENMMNELWGETEKSPSEKEAIEKGLAVLKEYIGKKRRILESVLRGASHVETAKSFGVSKQYVWKVWQDFVNKTRRESEE